MHVLLDHIQDKVMEAYAGYRDLVTVIGKSSESGQDPLSVASLRELLRDVCGDSRA